MRLLYINSTGIEIRIESVEDLVVALTNGLINEDTLMRREGRADWELARNIEEVLLVNALKLNFYDHGAAPMVPLVVGEDVNSRIFPEEVTVNSEENASPKNPEVDRLLSSARRFRAFLILGCIVSWIGSIGDVWFLRRFEYLRHVYGTGKVPLSEFPSFYKVFIHQNKIACILAIVVIFFAFFKCMFRLRDAMVISGKHEFSKSKFFTVLSLFVPLVNFVVPWLGVAEIRRAAISLSSPRASTGFGWASFVLAGIFTFWFFATKTNYEYYQGLEAGADFSHLVRSANFSVAVNSSLVLLLAMSFYTYATSVLNRLDLIFQTGASPR